MAKHIHIKGITILRDIGTSTLGASPGLNIAEKGIALHGLATIDTKQRQYDSVEQKSLEIMQEIGDLGNEAGTWQCMARINLEKANAIQPRRNTRSNENHTAEGLQR